MQLPPTSFFDRMDAFDDDDVDDIDDESILDMALGVFQPYRDLRWHYRSRHESLIAFSNRHFYNDRLIVFPAGIESADNLGVKYRKVEGVYRGRGGNPDEVRAVAEAATEAMRCEPDLSLGVVAVNREQAELLRLEIDRMVLRDDVAQAYLARWEGTLQPFFVKNLENVQGDERDVLFVSTVYGPNEPGNVMQRFGPINQKTGHRRLNVLFTRAKRRVELFTSMTAADVRVDESSSRGVHVLRSYLEYAATGRLEAGEATSRQPDSDFEIFVGNALRARGYEIVPQLGVAGFFLDLAVKHPAFPHGYLAGIECDGASYHSAKSARDRDALRQEILEGLGWTLYRIWSTDWFSDPKSELEKLLQFLEGRIQRKPQVVEEHWATAGLVSPGLTSVLRSYGWRLEGGSGHDVEFGYGEYEHLLVGDGWWIHQCTGNDEDEVQLRKYADKLTLHLVRFHAYAARGMSPELCESHIRMLTWLDGRPSASWEAAAAALGTDPREAKNLMRELHAAGMIEVTDEGCDRCGGIGHLARVAFGGGDLCPECRGSGRQASGRKGPGGTPG